MKSIGSNELLVRVEIEKEKNIYIDKVVVESFLLRNIFCEGVYWYLVVLFNYFLCDLSIIYEFCVFKEFWVLFVNVMVFDEVLFCGRGMCVLMCWFIFLVCFLFEFISC